MAVIALVLLACHSAAGAQPHQFTWVPDTNFLEAKHIQYILDQKQANLDLARIKLTLDKLVDPNTDIEAGVNQIDAMADAIRRMLGPTASSHDTLLALKRYLYEKGPWNDYRVFQYDFDDPKG